MGSRNANAFTRWYGAADLPLLPSNATTGAWTSQLSSNIYSFHKAAAATTSVVNIPIPRSTGTQGNLDAMVTAIRAFYKVATADLSSAPTAILNKLQGPAVTGIVARAAVTQALTFAGIDAVGLTATAGDHIAIVTLAAPQRLLDSESLVLSITMNEAATSVLDIFGMQVSYA